MKRILIISGYASFILLMAFTSISAQEVQTEKNIKVIIVDDSGKKTEIDTLIKDSKMSDTIKLGKGKIIVVDDSGNKPKGGKEQITVTVLSDEDDSLKITREVRVVSTDSMNWMDSEDSEASENIYVFNSLSPDGGNGENHQNTITWTEKDGKESGKKFITINDGDANHTEEHEIIMHIDSEEGKQDFEKTKYIIKRDGMVITVEGDDYNKVKEIVKEIERNFESKKNVTAKDPATPDGLKKDTKKK